MIPKGSGEPDDPKVFEVAKAKVDEVLAAVESGQIGAAEALALEREGKARKSLIESLEGLLG